MERKNSHNILILQELLNSTGFVLPLCDPAGARTQDPILKRDVLYLLSY